MTTPPRQETVPSPGTPPVVMTEAARRVLLIAEYEARLDLEWKIREFDLLLGLLHENDEAAALLRSRGMTLEGLRGKDGLAEVAWGEKAPLPLPLSALAGITVTTAAEEAGRRGCPVGTPHLLYALLRDDRSLVSRTLVEAWGVDLAEMRAAVWGLLAESSTRPLGENKPAYRPSPYTLPHGSAILGFLIGGSGVVLAYFALVRLAAGSGHTLDGILGVFHGSWTLVVVAFGGVLAVIPSRRRTGLGLLVLASVGVVFTLLNW